MSSDALDLLIDLVRRFEGCRLAAYKCPAGVWTIGWGETRGVKEGDVWTQEQADQVLRERAGQFMLATLKRCPQLLREPPERIAACTSLAYNIGAGAFAASSVSRHTARRDYQSAADSFLLWNKAAGRVLRGLTLRRQAERMTYLGTDA